MPLIRGHSASKYHCPLEGLGHKLCSLARVGTLIVPPAHSYPHAPPVRFDDQIFQLFSSSLFLAGAVAAIVGGWGCNKFGRKLTMLAGGICFGIGTILMAAGQNIPMLVIGRLVLGVGVGFAVVATPLYLSEMAPYKLRGGLNILFQLAVTIGIFAAQLINYGTIRIPEYGWRISLALGGVPALFLIFGAIALPDTPNSLVARGQAEEGRRVLQHIRGVDNVDAEFEDIVEAVAVAQSVKNPYRTILRRRYWPQLIMSILIPTFQQFTGINAIMFYAPQLFQAVGQSSDAALLSTVSQSSALWTIVHILSPPASITCLSSTSCQYSKHSMSPYLAPGDHWNHQFGSYLCCHICSGQVWSSLLVPCGWHPDDHL